MRRIATTTASDEWEWDPDCWKWDGHLFTATPVDNDHRHDHCPPPPTKTPLASHTCSSSFSQELNFNLGGERLRQTKSTTSVIPVQHVEHLDDEAAATLTLKLGGVQNYPKKPKVGASVCQVQGCGADLREAKDYHRRHKVCDMHSKATKALVSNVFQRFCQQCSRFHALQEFDEGKRSCRRRLAGHNKRRRKTQPDNFVNNKIPFYNNQTTGYLLMSLLKILSDMHSIRANETNDEHLLSHLLGSLASQGNTLTDKSIYALLQESQRLMNDAPSFRNSDIVPTMLSNGHQVPPTPKQNNSSVLAVGMPPIIEDQLAKSSQRTGSSFHSPRSSLDHEEGRNGPAARSKFNNFDLNDPYIYSDEGTENVLELPVPADLSTGSPGYPSWRQQDSHHPSPPRTSGNSDSGYAQSPSSSSGEAQSRTDRIVFKLFGKKPSDFPFVLRAQILDWLSHSPTDIESYIRPGCVILTLYLRLPEYKWEELCCDLSSSLSELFDVSDDDTFWRTGWIHTSVQNRLVFVYNGQIVVDTSLSLRRYEYSTILSVKPIAVPASERAEFVVKGINLSQCSTSLLCALEGNYLALEADCEPNEHNDGLQDHGKLQYMKVSCTFPAVSGRGFLEVEGHGLHSSFFPFIVAEKDICYEISLLESDIELTEIDNAHEEPFKMEARNQALEFIHEMGWLLHRNNLKSKLSHMDPSSSLFPFKRYKWLMEFSVDHNWCAIVRNLLDILFDGMIVGDDYPFLKCALFELGLLHRAVRRNSRTLVEILLRYTPEKVAKELSMEYVSLVSNDKSFLFRPDFEGPGGLTPLHVAAGRDGSEDVLDALTDDPDKVSLEAWKNARDSTGFTPEDYARLRGHFSYIHLVQRKISRRAPSGHVVVDIARIPEDNGSQKEYEGSTTTFEIAGPQLRSIKHPCQLCVQRVSYGSGGQSLLYRPAMLSMVAIAAVCVCVALLFKSSPEVYVFSPFRWEMLDYGSS